MPVILHIETSTKVGSVCVSKAGELLALTSEQDQKSHSARINPMISEVLQEAGLTFSELDAVAYSCGPGSYTGLRIGLSTAKGLCFRLNIPLIAVSGLKALAMEAFKHCSAAIVIPMIDARRDEVFCAAFNKSGNVLQKEAPLILDAQSFKDLDKSKGIAICGNGADKAGAILGSGFEICQPIESSAAYLLPVSHKLFEHQTFANLAYEEPNYLKEFYTTKNRHIN